MLYVDELAVKAATSVTFATAPEAITRMSLTVISVMVSVPASTLNVSMPSPPVSVSFPRPPVIVSFPFPPDKVSSPSPPLIISFSVPPVSVSDPTPPYIELARLGPVMVSFPVDPLMVTMSVPLVNEFAAVIFANVAVSLVPTFTTKLDTPSTVSASAKDNVSPVNCRLVNVAV